jgi:hypothetical protein
MNLPPGNLNSIRKVKTFLAAGRVTYMDPEKPTPPLSMANCVFLLLVSIKQILSSANTQSIMFALTT